MTLELHVVTGPSGAGKTTFARQQLDWEHRLYNLDDWVPSVHNRWDDASLPANADWDAGDPGVCPPQGDEHRCCQGRG